MDSAVCLSSVYKVKVQSVTSELITDVYSMKIENVIKEGGCLFIYSFIIVRKRMT